MKIINTKIVNGIEIKTIKADEGKVFKRISDNYMFGDELTLGYTYYINGKKLDKPLLEKPEDYIEVPKE